MSKIQVFACDHRPKECFNKNIPYTRLGLDDVLNGDFELPKKYSKALSEGAQMLYIWEKLKNADKPDYIAFCHYRRFFMKRFFMKSGYPIICNFNSKSAQDVLRNIVFTPDELYEQVSKYDMDFVIVPPVCLNDVLYDNVKNMFLQHENVDFTENSSIIDAFVTSFPEKHQEAVNRVFHTTKGVHPCNIFIAKYKWFDVYMDILVKTLEKIDCDEISKKYTILDRWLGFYLERFTTCFYRFLETLPETKLGVISLATISGEIHGDQNALAKI